MDETNDIVIIHFFPTNGITETNKMLRLAFPFCILILHFHFGNSSDLAISKVEG